MSEFISILSVIVAAMAVLAPFLWSIRQSWIQDKKEGNDLFTEGEMLIQRFKLSNNTPQEETTDKNDSSENSQIAEEQNKQLEIREDYAWEGIDRLMKAISRRISKPKKFKACEMIGETFGELGDREKAIEFYDKAIKYNPKSAEILMILGDEFMYKGDYAEAILKYEQASKLDPDNENYHKAIEDYKTKLNKDVKAISPEVEKKSLSLNELKNELNELNSSLD